MDDDRKHAWDRYAATAFKEMLRVDATFEEAAEDARDAANIMLAERDKRWPIPLSEGKAAELAVEEADIRADERRKVADMLEFVCLALQVC